MIGSGAPFFRESPIREHRHRGSGHNIESEYHVIVTKTEAQGSI
jgi:hypothetical protein